ncbi:MAG: GntR family transcriptional regulator [Burkholderiales bacterium]|nr:GntR family transcriptional regulator [Burkholderiales bacterium]
MAKSMIPMRKSASAATHAAPLYKEVQRTLLQCLAKGEWKPGDKLPPEPELAERFGVAIPTVRAGVGDLVAAGVLIRRQGRGTFVARHDSQSQEFRFSNILNNRHENISTNRTKVSMRKVKADPETAQILQLGFDDSRTVYQINSLLEAEGKPVALMELILPLPLFSKLRKADLEQSKDNLYSVYQRVCGVTVLRMEERVYARVADRDTGKLLKLEPNYPIIVVDRLAFTFDDRPVEIRRRTFEGLGHYYLFTHNRFD